LNTQEIDLLVSRAKRLLDYYEKVGVEFWGKIPAASAETPTREVVGMADYVSTAIDIDNAVKSVHKCNNSDFVSSLYGLRDAINIVIKNHSDLSAFVTLLRNCVEGYGINVKETGEDDPFFCELACYSRELVEKVLAYMEVYLGITRDSDLLKREVINIESIDERLRVALFKVKATSGQVTGTLPPRPGYTPEPYWWYIRF
jgi:hypothetical protein